jgi:hypothetical protein
VCDLSGGSKGTREYHGSTGVNGRTSASTEVSFNVPEFLVTNFGRLPQLRRQHIKPTAHAGWLCQMYHFIYCIVTKKDHFTLPAAFVSFVAAIVE